MSTDRPRNNDSLQHPFLIMSIIATPPGVKPETWWHLETEDSEVVARLRALGMSPDKIASMEGQGRDLASMIPGDPWLFVVGYFSRSGDSGWLLHRPPESIKERRAVVFTREGGQ